MVPTFNVNGNKTEFVIFGLRLLLAFLFSLVGWVSTLTALATTVSIAPVEVPVPDVALQTEPAA